MDADKSETRRLIRLNRFWLVLVVFYTLVGGYNYLERRIISYASRLQVRWETSKSANGQGTLIFSSSGAPFVITHLVAADNGTPPGREPETALAAIAKLPNPLFVRPKSAVFMSSQKLAKLLWVNPEGKRVAAPKASTPVQALFYEPHKVTTTE